MHEKLQTKLKILFEVYTDNYIYSEYDTEYDKKLFYSLYFDYKINYISILTIVFTDNINNIKVKYYNSGYEILFNDDEDVYNFCKNYLNNYYNDIYLNKLSIYDIAILNIDDYIKYIEKYLLSNINNLNVFIENIYNEYDLYKDNFDINLGYLINANKFDLI